MIRVEGLEYRVGGFALSMSIDVAQGEYVVLLGASGSGKTLLLESICGLLDVAAGRVVVDGRDVTRAEPRERRIGYVPQDGALFGHLDVAGNIAFGLAVAGKEPPARIERVTEVSRLLGIEHLLGRAIKGLSGGERQRVALGRALAIRPGVLLLDEPVSALDEPTREDICGALKRLHRQLGLSVMHVCHSLEEARMVSDRVGIVSGGRMVQCGTLEELENSPRSLAVARMLRLPNVFEARGLGDGRIEIGDVVVRGPAWQGSGHVHVRTAAARVERDHGGVPGDGEAVFRGRVADVTRMAESVRLELDGGPGVVVVLSHREAQELDEERGMALRVTCQPRDIVVVEDGDSVSRSTAPGPNNA